MKITIKFQYFNGSAWVDVPGIPGVCEQTVLITQEPLRCSHQRVYEEDEGSLLDRYHRAVFSYTADDWASGGVSPYWYLSSIPGTVLATD